MTFNIVAGHSPKSQGADGYINEVTENRKVKDALISILKENGATVYDCTTDASTANACLSGQVTKCNKHSGVDVHIHFNAGGGKGVETYVYSTTSKSNPYAKRVNDNIASLGFKNRGVKVNASLYVLRKSTNPALLIEVCFVDTKSDCDLYKNVGFNKIAEQIAKGLLNVSTLTSSDHVSTPTKTNLNQYKLTGDLYYRNGAGVSYHANGVFKSGTIITVSKYSSNNWGYVDGKGWVSLNTKYTTKV